MKLIRLVSVFDEQSEELIQEINIENIPLEILQKLFNNPNDPMLIKPYIIKQKKLEILNIYLNEKIIYKKGSIYQLDCFKGES